MLSEPCRVNIQLSPSRTPILSVNINYILDVCDVFTQILP